MAREMIISFKERGKEDHIYGQASYLDEHTLADTQYPNPLARAPLLSTYTITEPSNPTGQASYLDEPLWTLILKR
jgi:hypothetical protein